MHFMKELVTNGDLWTAVGGVSLTLLAVLMSVALVRKRGPRRGWTALCLAGVLAGIAGTVAFAPHPADAVVRDEGAALLLSPFQGSENKATLRSGDIVRVVKGRGEYAYVKTASDTGGWIRKAELARCVGEW